MNECTQVLSKNNNPQVVVSFRTVANNSPSPAALTFLYKIRTKIGVEFVRIGKDKYKANYKGA